MIRAGEASGALDAVLLRLAEFTEGQARLRQKIIGTMIYPLIMMVLGGGVLVLLMTVVVPKVTKIFDDMKVTLPWTTRLLIFTLEHCCRTGGSSSSHACVGSVIGFCYWIRSDSGQAGVGPLVLKLPVFGAAGAHALGRPLHPHPGHAAQERRAAADRDGHREERDHQLGAVGRGGQGAATSIREGESIATPLKKSGEFPPLVYHMVAIGERSGQLEDMLVNVADSYETQVERAHRRAHLACSSR